MASAPINPTQITPPRVEFIDPRTGAISREWYRFLLSLLNATQTAQDGALGPDTDSLVSSYSAMLDTLAQATESQATSASVDDVAVLQTQVQDLAGSLPSDIQSYLASIWAAVQDLALTPVPASSMVYPSAGIANSTGSAWGSSYTTTGSGSVVVLATAPTIAGAAVFTGTFQSQGYTVATLPTAGVAGRRAHVTDALAPTFLAALVGGGVVVCPVFDNGTAWVVG
jgi:hypothetical protein